MLRVLTTFMYIECIPFKTLETNNNYNRIKTRCDYLQSIRIYEYVWWICFVFRKKKKLGFRQTFLFMYIYIHTYALCCSRFSQKLLKFKAESKSQIGKVCTRLIYFYGFEQNYWEEKKYIFFREIRFSAKYAPFRDPKHEDVFFFLFLYYQLPPVSI